MFAKRWILLLVAAGSLAGGAIGGTVLGASSGNAASNNNSSSTKSSNASPSGSFRPNENAAHEAGESKEREAQENAGQFPTVP